MGTAVMRQDDLGRKVNCQATAEVAAEGGIEGDCYGFSVHEQPHLAAFSNGYNDSAGGDCGAGRIGPPPEGLYPGPGGGRHQNTPTDNTTHKKEESEDAAAAHKVLKMSPNAGGDKYDELNKGFPQGRGSADNVGAKKENDFIDTGNRDRSGSMDGVGDRTFAAMKAERNEEEAATKTGHSSPGDNCATRSENQKMSRKPGEQGNIALDGVQRAGSNNGGGMTDIPQWPAIPDLKFNDGNGEGAHSGGVRQRLERQEEQGQHGEMARGAFGSLTPASSTSTLPSEMSRQEQEMPQHIIGEYHKLHKEPVTFAEQQTSGQYILI